MKKSDVCNYLKGLVIPHMPDDFVIAKPFRHGLDDIELKRGISAFRLFLHQLFDKIATDENITPAKVYAPELGNDSIRDSFPILNDIAVVLFSLGIYGELKTEPRYELTVDGNDLLTPFISKKPSAIKKLNNKRKLELFSFLSDMGFYFEDLNLDNDIDLSKAGTFYITYENDDFLILGLKLIAQALGNIDANFLKLASVFMRCDFYPLANATIKKHTASASAFANPQSSQIRNWIVNLERHLMASGCKISCFSLSNTTGGGSFSYVSRKSKKTVCSINMGILGCEISIHGNHFSNECSILAELPENMLNFIKTGRSICGKMQEPNFKCKHGGQFKFTHNGETFEICKWGGFNFALSDKSDLPLYRKWIDLELAWS